MKPAHCQLCHRDFSCEMFHTGRGGELIQFRDYERLPEDWVGHSFGLEWFCRDHAPAARELRELDSRAALLELQERFGVFPTPTEPPTRMRDPSLWVMAIGPDRSRVFRVVHQATGRPAIEVVALLRSLPFELACGWPQSFESWRAALVAAGASVEVRYD